MKIEHVALYVNDLKAARDFFVRFLGGKSNSGYHNPRTGSRTERRRRKPRNENSFDAFGTCPAYFFAAADSGKLRLPVSLSRTIFPTNRYSNARQ